MTSGPCGHYAEFGQMGPQGIDQLGALAHQEIACAMLHIYRGEVLQRPVGWSGIAEDRQALNTSGSVTVKDAS